jgi:hypothetical protein
MLKSNPLGFANWLAHEVPDFNRSKADLYINAFHALGLTPEETTPSLIRKRIKDFRHEAGKAGQPMPTLKSLYKLGKPKKPEPPRIEKKEPDLDAAAGEARVILHEWMRTWDAAVKDGVLEYLHARDLQPVMDFVTTVRDHLRARIKSSH